MRTLKLLIAFFLLQACAGGSYSLLPPGEHRIGQLLVRSDAAWNRLPAKYQPLEADAVLTRHGTNLDSIIIFSDLRAGDALFRAPSSYRGMPRFESTMLPQDIMELTESSFRIRLGEGDARVAVDDLRILPGDRFEFAMNHTASNGFRIRGIVHGGLYSGRAWLIVYQAAADHYFDLSKQDALALFASARINKAGI